jgi:hypothetical protein
MSIIADLPTRSGFLETDEYEDDKDKLCRNRNVI